MTRRFLPALAVAVALGGGAALTMGCMNPTKKQVKQEPRPAKPGKAKAPKGGGGDASDASLYDSKGEHTVTVEVGGEKIPVSMYVPTKRKSNTLVVLIHGSGGSGPGTFRSMNMGSFHEKKGVVVMAPSAAPYPKSGRPRWNSGNFEETWRNDLELLENLGKAARKSGKVDKIVAVGFSNGAQMTNRWACEGTQVDAIITGAGTLAVPPKNCKRSIPNRTYVGDKDFRMDESPEEGSGVPSVKDTMALWKKINNCKDTPPTSDRKGRRVCHTWDCETPTAMCVVSGLAHKYPTDDNCGVDANEESWDFLEIE